MSERSSLRGSRLGATSYEDERGVEFAARQQVPYECASGHHFEMTFAQEADVPAIWECPRCGAEALRAATDKPDTKPGKSVRTHWDMLLERRSLEELEELLSERLDLLRTGSLPGGAHFKETTKTHRGRKSA